MKYKNELEIKKLFVKNFKKLCRNEKNQEITAEALGVSVDTIAKWRKETEPAIPKINNMVTICNYFKCDPSYLFERDRDSFSLEYEKISEITGLSSEAITILEKSNHDRKVLLNLLLSDRAVFDALMDCLFSLCWPSSYLINIQNIDTDDTVNRDYIVLSPERLKKLSSETPDNIYSKMRQIIESFRAAVPEWSSLCEDIMVEEDEDFELDENEVRQIVSQHGDIPKNKINHATRWIMDQYQELERREKDKQPAKNKKQ